jgi:hypothetical protein
MNKSLPLRGTERIFWRSRDRRQEGLEKEELSGLENQEFSCRTPASRARA